MKLKLMQNDIKIPAIRIVYWQIIFNLNCCFLFYFTNWRLDLDYKYNMLDYKLYKIYYFFDNFLFYLQ